MTDTARDCLYAEIQRHAGDPDATGAPIDAVLTQFLVVCEWEAPDGERWISKLSGDHARMLPPWRERGLASEVLRDGWSSNQDEDEDE